MTQYLKYFLVVLVSLLAVPRAASATVQGGLSPIAGSSGCIVSFDSVLAPPCKMDEPVSHPSDVAVDKAGAWVFAAGLKSLVAYRRSPGGGLAVLPNGAGCVTLGGAFSCQNGHSLDEINGVAASPDGKNVYATSSDTPSSEDHSSDALTTFTLSQSGIKQVASTSGCVSADGDQGSCLTGAGLYRVNSVLVTPDGGSIYTTAKGQFIPPSSDDAPFHEEAIGVFKREANGYPKQLAGSQGCLQASAAPAPCADVDGITGIQGLAASPDSRFIYTFATKSGGGMVRALRRDTVTGKLTQVTSSPSICASVDGFDGDCLKVPSLTEASSGAMSPDGKYLYVAGKAGLTVFSRNVQDGTLHYLQTISSANAKDVAITPNGAYVYATFDKTVKLLSRSSGTGLVTSLASQPGGCVAKSSSANCLVGAPSVGNDPSRLVVSADGKNLYTISTEGLTAFGIHQSPGLGDISLQP